MLDTCNACANENWLCILLRKSQERK